MNEKISKKKFFRSFRSVEKFYFAEFLAQSRNLIFILFYFILPIFLIIFNSITSSKLFVDQLFDNFFNFSGIFLF